MGRKNHITNQTRTDVMQFLLGSLAQGKCPYGKIAEAATTFNLGRQSVSLICKEMKKQRAVSGVMDLSRRKIRKRKIKHTIDYARIEEIPKEARGTITSLSNALGPEISRATVRRWAKKLLRHHSNSIKPLLAAHHMLSRLKYCLQALHYDAAHNSLKFKAMENTIHIDEKWFMLTRKKCSYYLTPMEADPLRVTESNNFIPKVMFICAVCRPVIDDDGTVLFDGKIGIWPLVEEVTAKRNNIPRGTKEMKPIQCITRQVIRDYIIKEIVPAIKEKWPSCLSKNIYIQQDNARTHISNTDAEFQEVANTDGFSITLTQQPAKSPDCNANNLGFFCAIQALQQQKNCMSADELIAAVLSSFNQLEAMTLNKVFLSLQSVLIEIMKAKGSNNFKLPHMQKEALIRQGTLPTNLEVPDYLVRKTIDYLICEESTQGIEALMEAMGISLPQEGGGVPDMNA